MSSLLIIDCGLGQARGRKIVKYAGGDPAQRVTTVCVFHHPEGGRPSTTSPEGAERQNYITRRGRAPELHHPKGQYMHRFSGFSFRHGGWGGASVYSDATHPIWHQNAKDPFCTAVGSGDEKTDFEDLMEEYFWVSQIEIRDKNTKLAGSLKG
jgi:hypothetical protein